MRSHKYDKIILWIAFGLIFCFSYVMQSYFMQHKSYIPSVSAITNKIQINILLFMTKKQKSQKNYVRKVRCTFACSYIIDMID